MSDMKVFYKAMYEAVDEDRKNANDRLCQYVLSDLEQKLGKFYFEFIDYVVVKELKEVIISLEEEKDPYQTPDKEAACVSGVYQTLSYFLTLSDYKIWVESRRKANETN